MNKETSEIAKLTERISKDPKSKLFVPLAEEYKKIGDIEMAIHVLSEGLKHNPGYVTARSILGRLLFDKGDHEGARKEFEEVVKAIPDNLLAQRKLGDIYALKNGRDEALAHYKIAAALNPGDEELSLLIADVEAGRDIQARLLQQKAKPAPEPTAGREKVLPPTSKPKAAPAEAVKTPAVAEAAGVEAREPASPPLPKSESVPVAPAKPVEKEPESPARTAAGQKAGGEGTAFAGAVETSAAPESPKPAEPSMVSEEALAGSLAAREAHEAPEEILVVEPLEEETLPEEAALSFIGTGVPETPEEHIVDAESISPELLKEEITLFDEVPAEGEQAEAVGIEAVPEPEKPVEAAGKSAEQSDDFTTDTLAELYIAQGFFEKAIDIYERMMADRPTSQGLKDKLERVKAMAAAAEAPPARPGEEDETPSAAPVLAEAVEYVPPPSAPDEEEITVDAVEVSAPLEELPEAGAVVSYGEKAPHDEEDITLEAEVFVEQDETEPAEKIGGKTPSDNIFAEQTEYQPKEEISTADVLPAGHADERPGEASYDIFMTQPAQKPGKARPLYTDFEPREYVPPTAELKAAKADALQAAPKPSVAARKDTIDRLENWLKNIKKEK